MDYFDHLDSARQTDRQASARAGFRFAGTAAAEVAILLCTYNGERFLAEQLASFDAQTAAGWSLHVSDDGSRDATWTMLEAYRGRTGAERVSLRHGPCQGFTRNFLSLACDRSIQAEAFAFADQDDVWLPHKLERALAWLRTVEPGRPAMYCGRTVSIDLDGRELGLSPLFSRPPDFRNALVQSLAGGNTQVVNRAARDLIAAAGVVDHVSHDWWFYQLICGRGGRVRYDPVPQVQYRQHGSNIVGSNQGWGARTVRARELLKGRLHRWNDRNQQALMSVRHLLEPASQAVLDNWVAARSAPFPRNLALLARSGVYRQTPLQDFGLWLAAFAGKI